MGKISWKEKVRAAMSKAGNVSKIADEIKVNRNHLYDFGSKGSINIDELIALAGWLHSRGYLSDADMPAWNDPGGKRATPAAPPSLICDTTCPECGQAVPGFSQGAIVCCFCGAPLGPECVSCGTVNLPKSKFCRGCAVALALDTPETAHERRRARRAKGEPEM